MKTRGPVTLDSLTYFLEPSDISHRVNALSTIYKIAGLVNFYAGESFDAGVTIHHLEDERASVTLMTGPAGYQLELCAVGRTNTNASIDDPVFVLIRGYDDSTWSIKTTPGTDVADTVTKFEYLTDIFYMDESQIFTLLSDALVHEGKDLPDDFEIETIKIFLYQAES